MKVNLITNILNTFTQNSENIETNHEKKKEKQENLTINSCVHTITYPFVKFKELIIEIFNRIVNFFSTETSEVEAKKEPKSKNRVKKILSKIHHHKHTHKHSHNTQSKIKTMLKTKVNNGLNKIKKTLHIS